MSSPLGRTSNQSTDDSSAPPRSADVTLARVPPAMPPSASAEAPAPLGVEETLQLLERLRATVQRAAAREQALQESARKRADRAAARAAAALVEAEARSSTDLKEVEAETARLRAAEEVRYDQRITRIRQGLRAARKAELERIEAEEGRRKFPLQREMLLVTRNRDAGLAAADARLAEFQARLAEQQTALAGIEQQARAALAVYGRKFVMAWAQAHETADVDLTPDEESLAAQLDQLLDNAREEIARFRRRLFTRLSALWAVWLVLVLVPLTLLPVIHYFGAANFTVTDAIATTVSLLVGGLLLHVIGRRLARSPASRIADFLGRARILHHASGEKALATHARVGREVETEFQQSSDTVTAAWQEAVSQVNARREGLPQHIEARGTAAIARAKAQHERVLQRIQREHEARLARCRAEAEQRRRALHAMSEEQGAEFNAEIGNEWEALTTEWRRETQELWATIVATEATPAAQAPVWTAKAWYEPYAAWRSAVRLGRAEVDLERLTGSMPEDARLSWPGPAAFSLPLLLTYPHEGNLLFEARGSKRRVALDAFNQIVLRLLATAPAGHWLVTIIDPVGLGQNFAGLTHLADEADHLIQGRVWTQPHQIEERLRALNDHIEKVIQMYLRNEFTTIVEYNEQAGAIAEKYHLLIVADFPANFSETAARSLVSILANGSRCGVYTLLHWDPQTPLPGGVDLAVLRKDAVFASAMDAGQSVALNGRALPGVRMLLEPAPNSDVATALVHRVAQASRDAARVEVPFELVAPNDSELWSSDTSQELRVPIGRTGASRLQFLALGKATRQHALIAGKTGSGKSTLFHVIITNLALWCRPDQVEFYLVDFKKGVEFKPYATHRLPHARVVAIESDREFGLSVLQRVDEELRRRGDLFRRAGVQDLPAYRRSPSPEPTPRVLLIIDEFQEFFVEEDRVAQGASLLLDRIVRQGRAFGIHVILGSQTLGGAYTVARTTLGQMVVRIALQCNEADAFLIMDENNPAPRLLSRPGEGIYNDAAGQRDANSPFQVVWLPDDVREFRLREVRALADRDAQPHPGPMVFEGDVPAEARENLALQALLDARSVATPDVPRFWLGAPNSIKGPTELLFERRSGRNLLLVGQAEDATAAILVMGLIALAAQHRRDAVRFLVLEGHPTGTPGRALLESVVKRLPHSGVIGRAADLDDLLGRAADELRLRFNDGDASPHAALFVLVDGVQYFKRLRQEDEFSFGSSEGGAADPSAQLRNLLNDGPGVGIHVIATCDNYANVIRFLGRKGLAEFGSRVLFQMSANDSASLVDHPGASRLGLHRALLYQEREGHTEIFRPYALPGSTWIDFALNALARLVPEGAGQSG